MSEMNVDPFAGAIDAQNRNWQLIPQSGESISRLHMAYLEAMDGDIAALEGADLSELEGRVTALETAVAELDARVTALEGVEVRVTQIETDLQEIRDALNNP